MLGESWKRPSIAVVLCTAVVIAVAVARGNLRVVTDATPRDEATSSSPRRSGDPVVVRPERVARAPNIEAATVHGRVLDSRGFLVVGAEVCVRGQSVARTDADGEFKASVTGRGATNLFVRHQGHRGRWIRSSTLSPDPLLVLLDPAAPWDRDAAEPAAAPSSLTGEGIVRGADGKPLVGAYVTATAGEVWSRTDDIGRYVLPLPLRSATLVVHQPGLNGDGGFAVRSEPLALPRSTGVVPLPELVAAPGASIRGTLRDKAGQPVAGVPVQLRGEGLLRVFESGAGGAFRIAGLLPGNYVLQPFAWRGASGVRHEVVLDRPVVDCELQMQTITERRVRVQDENGSPMALAYVAAAVDGARQSVAQADADGWAAVTVIPGDMQFEVRGADGGGPMSVRRYESEQSRLVVAAP